MGKRWKEEEIYEFRRGIFRGMDAIELVVEDLVRIAIMQLVFFYTNNNLNDKEIFHYSWLLLYRLRFKHALEKYIDIYEEYMIGEFDEKDFIDITNMEER